MSATATNIAKGNARGSGYERHAAFRDEAEIAPKKRAQREWQAQKADNAFLSKALPFGAFYTAIDHARKMTKQHGKQRKDRGIKAGLPDWLIVYDGITLWIERKAGSSLSEHQHVTREYLVKNGHRWALARSTEEIEIACREAGIPLRATHGDIIARIKEQQQRLPVRRKSAQRAIAGKDVSIKRVNALRQKVMF